MLGKIPRTVVTNRTTYFSLHSFFASQRFLVKKVSFVTDAYRRQTHDLILNQLRKRKMIQNANVP
jgi:hypothetical protein